MLSFHGVKNIRITEPKTTSSGYTNEIIIDDGDKEFTIDLYSPDRNNLKVYDEQIKTLGSILSQIVETSKVFDN